MSEDLEAACLAKPQKLWLRKGIGWSKVGGSFNHLENFFLKDLKMIDMLISSLENDVSKWGLVLYLVFLS